MNPIEKLLHEINYAIKNIKASTGKSYSDCIPELRRIAKELEDAVENFTKQKDVCNDLD
jgi:hypothetical protein